MFSNNTLYNNSEAKSKCDEYGGVLATIADEETRNITSTILEEYYINKYWTQQGMQPL